MGKPAPGVSLAHGNRMGREADGDFRPDFDPRLMAMAIRAAIDVAPSRLTDPEFDIDNYTHETVTLFHLATRATER